MSQIRAILLEIENMTDEEQVKLFFVLGDFANKELKKDTCLNIMTIPKEKSSI